MLDEDNDEREKVALRSSINWVEEGFGGTVGGITGGGVDEKASFDEDRGIISGFKESETANFEPLIVWLMGYAEGGGGIFSVGGTYFVNVSVEDERWKLGVESDARWGIDGEECIWVLTGFWNWEGICGLYWAGAWFSANPFFIDTSGRRTGSGKGLANCE